MTGDTEDQSELTVLICSANIGNAEPTPESFAEWVPDDGEIEGPLSKTKYTVEADRAAEVSGSLRGVTGKKFDIIVLGMQEAAFMAPKKEGKPVSETEKKVSNAKEDAERQSSSTSIAIVDDVFDAVTSGVSDIKKESSKSKQKFFRKLAKGNLLRKGLTTYKDYKSPEVCRVSDGNIETKDGTKENSTYTTGRYDSRIFLELIENHCPSYSIVTANIRGQMRLIVLALKHLTEEISDVYTAGENTGIAKVLANKGGIIVTFNLRGTRISFMTAHLEAHEGATHYANRNKNIAEIFNGARTDPDYDIYDATIISHHIFVCGDLNYRIIFGNREEKGRLSNINIKQKILDTKTQGKSSSSDSHSDVAVKPISDQHALEDERSENGTHFAQAKAFVDAEDWKALNDGDELAMALAKKDCLVGFTTLPCIFPPTFKVERGEGYQYINKRTPSYTDRILWKSAHGMSSNILPFFYEPCPNFITSDHKPIRGGYLLKTNRGLPGQPASISFKESDRQVHLLVSDMTCTNLPVMDVELASVGGMSDPYILFVSYPKSILWEKAWPSTNVISRNLNPVWEQDIHLTLDGDACRDDEGHVSFNGCMLYMTVMDEDFGSSDDIIGTVVLFPLFFVCPIFLL